MATQDRRFSKPSPADSGPVIDAEWRPLPTAPEAPSVPAVSPVPPRPVVVRARSIRAPATASGGRCPVCGDAHRPLVRVRVAGALNVKLCARCATFGFVASEFVKRLFG